MKLRHHTLTFCMVFCFFACHGSNSIVLGQVGQDHIRFSALNVLEVDQLFGTESGMDRAPAELRFEHVSGNTFNYLGNEGVAELGEFFGASLYFVEPGDLFSDSNLESGTMFQAIGETSQYELPESFFIGIRTPSENVFTTPFPIAYGWANISNNGGQLTLIDHAVSYSGSIVVGVPEPATGTLVFASLILLTLRRKK